ncbi:MAG: peptide chain release factor N(5)-glutamine methyltransferase [Bacteroidia bacterium]
MKLPQLINNFITSLQCYYSINEADQIMALVMEEVLGMKKVELRINGDREIHEEKVAELGYILEKLKTHMPVQYVLGVAWFDDLKLEVNQDVLIPRQETEELIHLISKNEKGRSIGTIVDLCSGSGCISLALKKRFPNAKVSGYDVSSPAIDLSRRNALNLHLDVTFLHADILELTALPEKADIIVSNPPYVRRSEATQMQPHVLDYEPHLALFVPDHDPLKFYSHIIRLSKSSLNPGGRLYFEINEQFGQEIKELLQKQNFGKVNIVKDLQGKERMITAELVISN